MQRKALESAQAEGASERALSNGANNEAERQRLADEARKAEENFRKAREEADKRLAESERAQENARKANEEAQRQAESARRAEEVRRASEAMRTEEGRRRIEQENQQRQEALRQAEEAGRKANDELRKREEEYRTKQNAQLEQARHMSSNPADTARNEAKQAYENAEKIKEEYSRAQSSLESATRDVQRHNEELHRINEEMERARTANDTARVNALAEASRKTQENLTRASNSAEIYNVQASLLQSTYSDAVKVAESAQQIYDKTSEIAKKEHQIEENRKKIEEYKQFTSSYGSTSSNPSVENTYKEIQRLEQSNREATEFIRKQNSELVSSVQQVKNDGAKMQIMYGAVSEQIHKERTEVIQQQNIRNAENNVLKEKAYVNSGYDTPLYNAPKYETPKYEPSIAKRDPIPVADEKINHARINGTGRDTGYSSPNTPEVTSGQSFGASEALKNAAFNAPDTSKGSYVVAPPSERTTGVIDYGNYKVTYEFNKSDAAAFQKFSENVTANKMSAMETGNMISSTSQPAEQRFRPTTMIKKDGESVTIDKEAVKSGKHAAQAGDRGTTKETQTEKEVPYEQVKMQQKLHTRIDVGTIANTALTSAAKSVGRNLGQTDAFYGLTKTYRAAKGTAEIASLLMTTASRDKIATQNVTNFIKSGKTSSQATFFMTKRYTTQANFSKINSLIETHNMNNPGKKIGLIDDTFGLGVKKGVAGNYSDGIKNLMKKNKITDLTKLSDKDFDKLIAENPGLKKELLSHKKANQLLQAKANSLQLTKEEIKKGMKGDISKLSDAQIASVMNGAKKKGTKDALASQTGIKGFNKKLDDKISNKNVRDRKGNLILKKGYNKKMMAAENSAAQLASSLLGGKYSAEQLKNMSVHDLKSLLRGLKGEDAQNIKEAINGIISIKQTAEQYNRSMLKKPIQAIFNSYRRAAQNSESMAGYYEVKQAILSAKGAALNTYKVGRWVFKKLGLNNTKLGKFIGKIDAGVKKVVKTIKQAPKKFLKKQAKRGRVLAKKGIRKLDKKLFKGRARKGVKKVLGKLASPFKLAGKGMQALMRLFAKIMEILKRILMPIIKYIIIGVLIVVLSILATNFLMYAVGTVGGMITSFWENLWAENIMDSQAGKTLNNLISYDEYFYERIDQISETAESLANSDDQSKMNFMRRFGISNCYGFYDPTYGKDGYNEGDWLSGSFGSNNTKRYHIRLPGMPYGVAGYEQYYFDGNGNNIARYSNSKDILAVGYAAFDTKVNVIQKVIDGDTSVLGAANSDTSYSFYCRELWEKTHMCIECDKKFTLDTEWRWKYYGITFQFGEGWEFWKIKTRFRWGTYVTHPSGQADADGATAGYFEDGEFFLTFGMPIPLLRITGLTDGAIHCHATPVYACTDGKCNKGGSQNKYTYYCNRNPQNATHDRNSTQDSFYYGIYDIALWKGPQETPVKATSDKNSSVYLCLIDGNTSDTVYPDVNLYKSTGNKGCIPYSCSPSGTITAYDDYADGHTEGYSVNLGKTTTIGYDQYKGTTADNVTRNCWNPETTTGHNIKTVKNNPNICTNKFFVQHSPKETKNGSCGKSDDTCTKVKQHGDGSPVVDINGNSYNFATGWYAYSGCNYTTKKVKLRCNEYYFTDNTFEYSDISLSGTFKYTSGSNAGTSVTESNDVSVYKCTHNPVKVGTETQVITYYWSSGDLEGQVAGTFTVNVPIYECGGVNTTIYLCQGECTGYYVCGGHSKCLGHKFCNGHQMIYCTGHVDVYTKIRILGVNDIQHTGAKKNIFEASDYGAGEGRMQKSEVQDLVRSTYDGDWEDLYNISFQRSNSVSIILSDAEKFTLAGVFEHKPGVHSVIADWALTSVARIPYYKNSSATGNCCDMSSYPPLNAIEDYQTLFRSLVKNGAGEVVADSKGRVLMGLDEKKFVQYMYYTANHISKADYQASFDTFLANNFTGTTDGSKIQAGDVLVFKTKKDGVTTAQKASILIRKISSINDISDNPTYTYLTVECSDSGSTVVYGQQKFTLGIAEKQADGKTYVISSQIFKYNNSSNCFCMSAETGQPEGE